LPRQHDLNGIRLRVVKHIGQRFMRVMRHVRLRRDPQCVVLFVIAKAAPLALVLVKYQRPLVCRRDHVKTVFTGRQRLAVDVHISVHLKKRRFIGSRAPHLAVGYQAVPDLSSVHVRPVIYHRDLCITYHLGDLLPLAYARHRDLCSRHGRKCEKNECCKKRLPHFSNLSFALSKKVFIISVTFLVISLLIRLSPASPASICSSRAERRLSSTICENRTIVRVRACSKKSAENLRKFCVSVRIGNHSMRSSESSASSTANFCFILP